MAGSSIGLYKTKALEDSNLVLEGFRTRFRHMLGHTLPYFLLLSSFAALGAIRTKRTQISVVHACATYVTQRSGLLDALIQASLHT